MANGVTIYRGPSMLTGDPIVAIATERTANPKTGPMVQLWILAADRNPFAAATEGADRAVCGGCTHRGDPTAGAPRTCYVTLAHAPSTVWRAWREGKYPELGSPREIRAWGAGRLIRLGAYGDPAALPARVVRALTARAAGSTGYTHQWQAPRFRWLRRIVMASVDSVTERTTAKRKGWRTFRVGLEPGAGEISCPASAEAGHRTTCAQCRLCDGRRWADRRKDIVIRGHGPLRGARA